MTSPFASPRTRLLLAPLLAGLALLAGCERPPMETSQNGFRGTGMEQVVNPRIAERNAPLHASPEPLPPAPAEGPKAGQVYQNVKVLGDLSVAQFARHMVSITAWVSPKQGCNYCHVGENFADDSKYTKVVARRMIEMTRHINADWQQHVAATGVTCYTCHRGNNVPANVWYKPLERNPQTQVALGNKRGQNTPVAANGLSSLPVDPFTPYLLNDATAIRIGGTQALPYGNPKTLVDAEQTYSLMMHMSKGLGVNCTFCHNSQHFGKWSGDVPPQRATAWYGIRMARDINANYVEPLTPVHPAARLGPAGDIGKVNCATCHQGANKPLLGKSLLQAHPELMGARLATAAGQPAGEPMADGVMVFFAVGSAGLTPEAEQLLAGVVEQLKANPGLTAAISGFHSASGDLAGNQELAKQRAMAVRDALERAGVALARVQLSRPASAGANVAGEDPKARRVEVSLRS